MRDWLTYRTHLSWHIAASSFGLLVGASCSLVLPVLFADRVWLLVAGVLIFCAILRRYRWLVLVACLSGMLIGAWRGMQEQSAIQTYRPYYGQLIEVRGTTRDDVSFSRHGDQRFQLHEVHLADSPPLHGKVWVSSAQKTDIKRGDTVIVRGKLNEGFGNMSASIYRAAVVRVERPHPGDVARVFRDWFADGIRRGVPEPEASLGIGYLTGQRSALPAQLDEQLRIVGLTHAVVASGYNLTILVSFARNLLANYSKYLATLFAGVMVALFMMITGLSPSMARAGLVSGLSLATWYYGRAMHPFVLLPFAAAITVCLQPAYVWGDIGWCLSFAAFFGVIVAGPLIKQYFWGAGQEPPLLARVIIETVAAQLVTLPIILFCFGQFASYALLANLLVLPLVPLAMVCTFAAGLIGLLVPGMAYIAGLPATWLLRYMIWVVERVANWPGAQQEIRFGLGLLVASYVLLVLLGAYVWRKTGLDFRRIETKPEKV